MKTEYDNIKGMLKTLRGLDQARLTENKNIRGSYRLINEQEETQQPEQSMKDDVMVINDVDIKMSSPDSADMKLMDDQKNEISGLIDNFRQQVSQIVTFEPGFTITPDQIRLDGALTDDDVKFVFIAGKESGVYINAEMLKLEQNTANTLEKLAKFNETFKTTMEPLITQRNNN
jgi:hypothetical protein